MSLNVVDEEDAGVASSLTLPPLISVLNDASDIPVLTVPYSVPYESDPS